MPLNAHDHLKGLFNITVTPFAADGTLDFAALADSVERMVGLHYDGLLIGGTYGEFPAMTPSERAELFRRSVEFAAGRLPVMLCSAAADVRVAQELTDLAVELGGYPMLTAPYVSEVNDDHIFEYFSRMAPRAKGRLVIYNAPGIGITLSPRLIERVATLDGVVALKQGDLNATVIDELANRLGGRVRLFCASDLAFLGPLMAGFDGLSSTNSCAFPELIQAIYRAAAAGDARTAIQLHRSWYKFRELARRYGQPQAVKAAMMHRGWGNGHVRQPLLRLSTDRAQEIAGVTSEILSASRSPAPQMAHA